MNYLKKNFQVPLEMFIGSPDEETLESFFVADKTTEEDINPFEFISQGLRGMRGDKGAGTTFWFADITDQTDDLFALGMSEVYKDMPEKDIIEMLNKTYPDLQKVTKNNKRESRLILGTVYKCRV